ncbi:hypothetical protein [Williamsia serinedens]|uniref:Mce-associated membrane protein n=1 Tax=Williamsia serinedens TaxID=391736 RepID=A0ABT1HAX3_9NOCA|nr:hypothetical protein [Williamsia serinedens]MCP2162968.1 Mce-associated membrane protein [Williamsia serinedens]
MTTPRGPRGNRRPRVAGRPATRPTSPDRPTSRPTDDDATTPETVEPSAPDTDTSAPATPVTETPEAETSETETPAAASTAGTTPADPAAEADEAATDTADAGVDLGKKPAAPASPRGKSRPAVKVSTIKPQSTRPAPKRPTAAATDDATRPSRRRRFLGWRTVGVLAAIAVVIGVVAGVAAAKPGVDLSDNKAFVDASLTSQVSAQAKTRICSVFAVNYAKLDDWERTAKANVTGEASTRFTQYAGAVRDALGQTGLTEGGVDCRVDTVGVRSITGDSATLVVNLILSQTEGQTASGSGTKRYQVSMQQVNGQWLVADFSDF